MELLKACILEGQVDFAAELINYRKSGKVRMYYCSLSKMYRSFAHSHFISNIPCCNLRFASSFGIHHN